MEYFEIDFFKNFFFKNQTEENIKKALDLIQNHQLFKLGLSVFKSSLHVLAQVRELLGWKTIYSLII